MSDSRRSDIRRFGGRALAVGCGLAAIVAGVPGTAYAVDNLPPKQPLVQDLQTEFKACGTGDTKVYVASPTPTLTAVLHDPVEDDQPGGANMVQGEFEAWWTDAAGAEQRLTYTTYQTRSGVGQSWRMPQGIPANTVVSWHVRANDGTATSAWSSEDGGSACQFVIDDVSPEKAVVTSAEYPQEQWQDGVGVYGSFTLDSPSPDVVAYDYGFIGGPYGTVRPDEMGGPATVRFLPLRSGPDYVTVRAIDRSGRSSTTTTYHFYAKAGRAPVAHWKLGDAAGSTTAAAETGTAARAGTGVVFGGEAPKGTGIASTARLDGSSHGFLTPDAPAVDTRKTFAVSAWVRPAQTDRTMTVASQDTDKGAGFTLGLRSRDSGATWSFTVGAARVTGGAPETGEWAHLLGLYDTETGRAKLYVNGHEVGNAVQAAPAEATGAFQIGRVRDGSRYHARWHGDLGDIQAYDRVVVPDEVTRLAYRKPQLLGHWSLETATDGVSPEQKGGAPLRLGPGATIHRGPDDSCIPDLDPDCPVVPYPLVGDGNLKLDGESGHATLDGPVVDTADSFTIGVVVRLADDEPNRPMTLLSQAGEHTDAFKLRYEPTTHAWQLVVPEKDEAGAPEKVVAQVAGYHGVNSDRYELAVVYDDATDKIKLYMNGYTDAAATADLPNGWHSNGPLQVGRSRTADGWGEYLHGDLDEIQAYAGALRDKDINGLGGTTNPCLCG